MAREIFKEKNDQQPNATVRKSEIKMNRVGDQRFSNAFLVNGRSDKVTWQSSQGEGNLMS